MSVPNADGIVEHVVFSIATNGYEEVFKDCLDSQRDYCKRYGLNYCLIQGCPPWGINAHDSSWLKIPALKFLLSRCHGGVLYLDADCEVSADAPDIRRWDADQPEKCVFACEDFSNRLNAAVIYWRSTLSGRSLIRKLVWSSFVPSAFIPRQDRNLYENGHFIWVLKNSPLVHIMPQDWNAGLYREKEHPFILHHGGTIMRESRGEKPLSLNSRLFASWTGIRLPFHLAYFRHCLTEGICRAH